MSASIIERVFYTTAANGDRIYMVLTEVFNNEICHGYDPKVVARVLLRASWLEPDKDGHPRKK